MVCLLLAHGCWEYKLCRSEATDALRAFISSYQPDIIFTVEVRFLSILMMNIYLAAGIVDICAA